MPSPADLSLPDGDLDPLSGEGTRRESVSTSLLLISQEGRIVHANAAWFRLADALQLSGPNYRLQGDYLLACQGGWGWDLPEIKRHGADLAELMRCADQPPRVLCPVTIAGERRWLSISALPLECISNTGILVMLHEVTDDILREEALAHQAFFDALTDLPNYALFIDRLSHAVSQSSRSGEPLATMIVDIDDFKYINDTYGHLSGNRVLSEVARRLSACLRECDTVARLGGDEFAILLPGIGTPEAAAQVAEKMLAALGPSFLTLDGQAFQLTASIGIALCPLDGTSQDRLMHHADQAMYQAKDAHKLHLDDSTFRLCDSGRHSNRPGAIAG